jgi:DNA-binding NarL/FixJ family response regulator
MIRLFIVDDHEVVVEGITTLLHNPGKLEVIGYAYTGESCLQFFRQHSADVIFMDISLPDTTGVDLCGTIKRCYPSVMVLALSTLHEGTYIHKMMQQGASGYLLKNANRVEMLHAIELALQGKHYLSREAEDALRSHQKEQSDIPALTRREKEVLQGIADGLTNNQIAERLFISHDTVDSHRKNLHTKLRVKNTAMLIRSAIQFKLIE